MHFTGTFSPCYPDDLDTVRGEHMSLAETFGVDLNPAQAGDYASTGCPDGHETLLSFLDRTEPETLAFMDLTMPDALDREEAWLAARSAELGLPVLMVAAPPVWVRNHGAFQVIAFATPVLEAMPHSL